MRKREQVSPPETERKKQKEILFTHRRQGHLPRKGRVNLGTSRKYSRQVFRTDVWKQLAICQEARNCRLYH